MTKRALPISDEFRQLREQVEAQPISRVDPIRPVWIFGAGNFGRSLASVMQKRGINVAGFVETSPKTNETLGLPIIDWAALAHRDPNAQLALGIFNRSTPYDQLASIAKDAGFPNLLMPWSTYDQFGKEMGWRFWLSARDFLTNNLDRVARAAEKFADEESQQTLRRICAFRLGLDLNFASAQSDEHQYFNNLTLPALQGKTVNYVDCGAYNGDTYIDLISRQGIACQQAFLLEPDPENFANLVQNVTDKHPGAICLPLAAAEKYEILTFGAGQGEGGIIGAGGNMNIAAVALDQLLPHTQVDLVKVDVEGAEAQVLKGASRTIKRCRPVLAMSLYHNPQDLWELPELLFDICPDYKFYVRQHYYNSLECVLYAVPEHS
jgi:FkbM family methyltransferase